jgi:hypothetical protein
MCANPLPVLVSRESRRMRVCVRACVCVSRVAVALAHILTMTRCDHSAIRKTPGGTARAVGVKQNFSVQAAAAAAAAANAGHNKPAVRRALGLRQGANGTVPRTMPLTANPTPGREGDI